MRNFITTYMVQITSPAFDILVGKVCPLVSDKRRFLE